MRIFCSAKDFHIFPTKNNGVFVIFTYKTNETITNDVVNFEQLAPECKSYLTSLGESMIVVFNL